MDNGAQILAGLAQARVFFRQISLMLRTAEDMLMEEGWESIWGRRSSNITSDYLRPERWMPRDIYRFYIANKEEKDNSSSNGLVIYTGVLLDQEGVWEGFTEPWITCGAFRFKPDFDIKGFNYWDWVRSALDDKHEPDGVFHEYVLENEEEDEELLFQAIMALPLIRVTEAEVLKQLIIAPLLQKIDEIRQSEPRVE